MPWRELSVMEQREEFVRLALSPGANVSELCRRFGISRSKGYKWLGRYRAEGRAGLADRSRRPWRSPLHSSAAIEAVRHCDRVDIVVLYPDGCPSEVQRRQMTTVDAANVRTVADSGAPFSSMVATLNFCLSIGSTR